MFVRVLCALLVSFVFACSAHATPNWKLPWTAGESWQCQCSYGCNLHNDDNNGYHSVDFDKAGLAENGPDQPVLAAASGTVTFTGLNGAYGYCVKIDHGGGYVSMYAHLRYNPTVSGSISQGQQIGVMGGTGTDGAKTYSDHIHFMVYYNNQCKSYVNESKPEPMSDYSNFTASQYYLSENTGLTFIATQTEATIAEPGPYYPGDIITCTIKWRNDGTATWSNQSGSAYVELGSCNSAGTNFETSYLYASGLGWISDKVPCTFSPATVAPTQTATFSFQGKVPDNAQPDQEEIYFGPVYNSQIMQGWDGNGFTITVVEPAPPPATGFTELVGKFTSDGYSDVCVYEPGNGKWWVAANTTEDNCFDRQNSTPWIDAFSTGSSYIALTGDIGGSDLDDICTLDTVLGRWKVAYSTGSAFSNQPGPNQSAYWLDGWGVAGANRYTPLLGDFNNDGFKEPLLYEAVSGDWFVSFRDADSNRFNTQGQWIDAFGDGVGQYIPLTGNFVGDGKYDIALYHKSSGNWYVAENTGSAFVRCSPSLWITGFGNNGTYIPFAGQIRGDVLSDIGLFQPSTGNWFVAQSTGSAFTKLNGQGQYYEWISDFGTSPGYRPLFGYFSWDSYMDIGLYQPSAGSWFVAINDGNPDRFTRSDGLYPLDAWLTDWAKISGSPKLVSEPEVNNLPITFLLAQNYPNPFNPATSISFSLPTTTHVKLEVYNILGQRVALLVNDDLPAGNHTSVWNADKQASGIYFYRLRTEDADVTKKMLLLK